MKQFIVSHEDENQRVDKYVMKILSSASKSFIYKMFRKKNITLNNKKIVGKEVIVKGDTICIYFSDETFNKFSVKTDENTSRNMDFDIVYEDDNILVCNKPVGLLSQPDGEHDHLVGQISYYLSNKGTVNTNTFKPGICNRLDRNTSGIVVAGKNIKALQCINKAIKDKTVDKVYHCIVNGKVVKSQVVEGYLYKNRETNKVAVSTENNKQIDGDYIKTIYEPIKSQGGYTLLKVKIVTGKSHQIRAHLSSISLPIIGDYKYGNKKVNDRFKEKYKLKSQLLHAYEYTFINLETHLKYLENKKFSAPYNRTFDRIYTDIFKGD